MDKKCLVYLLTYIKFLCYIDHLKRQYNKKNCACCPQNVIWYEFTDISYIQSTEEIVELEFIYSCKSN